MFFLSDDLVQSKIEQSRSFFGPKGCYPWQKNGQNEKLTYRWGEIEQKRTWSSVFYEVVLMILNFAKTTEQFVLRFSVQRWFLIIWKIIEKQILIR